MATRRSTHTSGKSQRQATPAAKAHTPDLSHFYRYKLPPIVPGAIEFKLNLLRPGLPDFSLDNMVQQLSWTDEAAALTGAVTLFRPLLDDPRTLPISRGHRIRAQIKWGGGLYELWTMRVDPPQMQVDAGQMYLTLSDDMVLFEVGHQEWIFRKTKRRPFGWTADEIARAVAAVSGIKVGELTRGTLRFSLTIRKGTPLDVVKAAYAMEKKHSGKAYVIRRRNGMLEVVLLQRNPLVYVLGDQIQMALVTQKAGVAQPVSILTGVGSIGSGHSTRKVTYTEYDRKIVAMLGAVRKTKRYGTVDSVAQLRGFVQRDLAAGLRVNDTVTIMSAGVPFINRGDGVKVYLPSEGYDGQQSFVYCTRAAHQVVAGDYTTQWDFTVADPYLGAIPAEFTTKAKKNRSIKRASRSRPKLTKTKH